MNIDASLGASLEGFVDGQLGSGVRIQLLLGLGAPPLKDCALY